MNRQEKKEYLAKLNFCRSFLYLGGMLTDKINARLHEKIRKYQDKNKIEITPEEMNKPEFKK